MRLKPERVGLSAVWLKTCPSVHAFPMQQIEICAGQLGIERLHVNGDFERMSSTAQD